MSLATRLRCRRPAPPRLTTVASPRNSLSLSGDIASLATRLRCRRPAPPRLTTVAFPRNSLSLSGDIASLATRPRCRRPAPPRPTNVAIPCKVRVFCHVFDLTEVFSGNECKSLPWVELALPVRFDAKNRAVRLLTMCRLPVVKGKKIPHCKWDLHPVEFVIVFYWRYQGCATTRQVS